MKKIKAVALDIDGVLTDGTFIWGTNGEEYKQFSFSDVMGISLASKSSIYELPALDIACEWPGIRLANSPNIETDDGAFVLSSGILSIIFVSSCDSALYEVFKPHIVFEIGSSP